MKSNPFPTRFRAALVLFAVALFVTTNLAATEKVLHNFGSWPRDGKGPQGALIFDSAGNLYGTTLGDWDCSQGCGTVFELTPHEGGHWTAKVLHYFRGDIGGSSDGACPRGNLIFDSAGNLYGTTAGGGVYGEGTVFEMTPRGDGTWIERVLHHFGQGEDGKYPPAGLIFDAAGNLYGMTSGGGVYGGGTVFEMTSEGDGTWTERVMHNFGISETDGTSPSGSLIFDSAGNLYGTTGAGGYVTDTWPAGCGTVFELTPRGDGTWTERVLHFFGHGRDGVGPQSGLIFDSAGNLYGTTADGGEYNYEYGSGTAFELTPRGDGTWTENVLHFFGHGMDGMFPSGSLVFDAAGNLYGTTKQGGTHDACVNEENCGTVFEVTPN